MKNNIKSNAAVSLVELLLTVCVVGAIVFAGIYVSKELNHEGWSGIEVAEVLASDKGFKVLTPDGELIAVANADLAAQLTPGAGKHAVQIRKDEGGNKVIVAYKSDDGAVAVADPEARKKALPTPPAAAKKNSSPALEPSVPGAGAVDDGGDSGAGDSAGSDGPMEVGAVTDVRQFRPVEPRSVTIRLCRS